MFLFLPFPHVVFREVKYVSKQEFLPTKDELEKIELELDDAKYESSQPSTPPNPMENQNNPTKPWQKLLLGLPTSALFYFIERPY